MPASFSGRVGKQLGTLFTSGAIGQRDDGRLLELFVERRDEAAFEILLERHGPMVLRICRAALDDSNDVDDAFQAVFLVLIARAKSVRSGNSIASWLFGVATRVSARARVDRARRRQREERSASFRPETATESLEHDTSGLIPALHEEISRLPDRYREPLVLCYFEGQTGEAVALRLGRPIGTIKARLSRARRILEKRLKHRGIVLPAGIFATITTSEVGAHTLVATSLICQVVSTGSKFVAGAAIPSSQVSMLVEGAVAGMSLFPKGALLGLAFLTVLVAGVWAARTEAVPEARVDEVTVPRNNEQAKDNEFAAIQGIVVMPDGSPVPEAMIDVFGEEGSKRPPLRTDREGKFQVHGLFANGVQLRAAGRDGIQQVVLRLGASDIRKRSAAVQTLTLQPTRLQVVKVVSEGKAVSGATVYAAGGGVEVTALTDANGKVEMRVPIDVVIDNLIAWHPDKGIQERRRSLPIKETSTEMKLLPPAPFRIQVVDDDGNKLKGLEINAGFVVGKRLGVNPQSIEASRVRTDHSGLATVTWAPQDKLSNAYISVSESGWRVARTDTTMLTSRIIRVHLSRKHERVIKGRLVMPKGVNPQGILVLGSNPMQSTRCRSDGSFTFRVREGEPCSIGISDLEWACDVWSDDGAQQANKGLVEAVLNTYPAIPITVRASRGVKHSAVTNAAVIIFQRSLSKVPLALANDGRAPTYPSVGTDLDPDAQGIAQFGAGRGELQVTLYTESWKESKTAEVTTDKVSFKDGWKVTKVIDLKPGQPVEVDFHREWEGERKVAGRLMLDGAIHRPSPEIIAQAWSMRPPRIAVDHSVRVSRDGEFDVSFDAPQVSLLFIDPSRRLSGFAVEDGPRSDLAVTMEKAASLSGVLVDEQGQPIAGRSVRVLAADANHEIVPACQTDKDGRFDFPLLPASISMLMNLESKDPDDYLFINNGKRILQPGEMRTGERLTALRQNHFGPVKKTVAPPTKDASK